MICKFCGENFAGGPIKQGGQIYCSIGCADLAAEIIVEDDEYYDKHELDLETSEDE